MIIAGSDIRATPPSRADVGGNALERHHRAGAGVLGDLRLLGRDHVHDHAALEHLGEAGLHSECRALSHAANINAAPRIPASSASRPGAAAIAISAPLAENQIVMLANSATCKARSSTHAADKLEYRRAPPAGGAGAGGPRTSTLPAGLPATAPGPAGRRRAVVDFCKGKSNKIAIIQGQLSAAASAYTLKGVEDVLAKHSEIKVVSSQAADWDASKAKGIAQTVLKQNPDLCGIVGFWDGMDIGTAAAIKEAGLTGKVFLATSGGGEQKGACDQVKNGSFDLDLSYDVPTQASNMAAMIKWLLVSGLKPGTAKASIYTTLIPITKDNASAEGTCWTLDKS